MKKLLFILFFLAFILHFCFRIYSYRSEYLSKYDADYWKERYLKSQWVVPNSKEGIGDDGLYAYVSWEYINGRDPTTLNAELPPFGKYMIGLSILIFKNQNIFAALSGIFALVSFYLLNTQIIKNKYLAFIPVALFSFEPLFYTQLRAPLLDLLYLGLLMTTFYFLLKKQYLFSAIALGLMIATKSSLTTLITVVGSSTFYLLLSKQHKALKVYFLYLPLSILVFLATYFRYFLTGNSIRDFLGVQKWILNFYSMGAKGEFITPWRLLLTGEWQTWFSGVQRVPEWHIGWVVLFVLSVISIFTLIKNRKIDPTLLIAIWVVGYLLFISFIPMWPRYLLLLLPFMYNLLIWRLAKSILHI